MKKINVINEKCIGCGACVAIDPEHFEFNENGESSPITNENLESETLTNAIESCPTSAIEIIESEETKECKCNEGETCTCEECDCHEEETCNCEECNCNEGNPCDCEECNCHKDENETSN